MDKLIVICEGGIHSIEYLHKNGVFPNALVVEPGKFQEMSPYLTQEDDILLLIKGLTDFTMSSIYALLTKFKELESKFKRVTIMTNIPLGAVPYDYYLYYGDLFYGGVTKVINKKIYELDANGNVLENQKGIGLNKNYKNKKMVRNPIMFQYKKYNNRRVKLVIYGKVVVNESAYSAPAEFEYEKKIKLVDLYATEDKEKTENKENNNTNSVVLEKNN